MSATKPLPTVNHRLFIVVYSSHSLLSSGGGILASAGSCLSRAAGESENEPDAEKRARRARRAQAPTYGGTQETQHRSEGKRDAFVAFVGFN